MFVNFYKLVKEFRIFRNSCCFFRIYNLNHKLKLRNTILDKLRKLESQSFQNFLSQSEEVGKFG